MSATVQQLSQDFPILTPAMDIETLPWTGGMEFYEGLQSHFGSFSNHVLVSCHEFDAAWPTWECHPKGDELVILMSGSATMALLVDGEQQTAELLQPGDYIVVPRGIWHTAVSANDARMLFFTPGEGTENLETPPGL